MRRGRVRREREGREGETGFCLKEGQGARVEVETPGPRVVDERVRRYKALFSLLKSPLLFRYGPV